MRLFACIAIMMSQTLISSDLSSQQACLLPGLRDTVIILPRVVSRIHDSMHYEAAAGEDPLAWDVAKLVGFVRALLERTGATSLPSLDEWAVLADKVHATLRDFTAYHRWSRRVQVSSALFQDAQLSCDRRGSCRQCTSSTMRRLHRSAPRPSPPPLWTRLAARQVRRQRMRLPSPAVQQGLDCCFPACGNLRQGVPPTVSGERKVQQQSSKCGEGLGLHVGTEVFCLVAELLGLCHSGDVVSSAAHMEAAAAALYRSMQDLEHVIQRLERQLPDFRQVTGALLHPPLSSFADPGQLKQVCGDFHQASGQHITIRRTPCLHKVSNDVRGAGYVEDRMACKIWEGPKCMQDDVTARRHKPACERWSAAVLHCEAGICGGRRRHDVLQLPGGRPAAGHPCSRQPLVCTSSILGPVERCKTFHAGPCTCLCHTYHVHASMTTEIHW